MPKFSVPQDIDERELVELARLEAAVENARAALSRSLMIPRTLKRGMLSETAPHVDQLLVAAGHALTLSNAALALNEHLLTRACTLLDRQRKEVLVR